jgi:hypothetical protein
MAKKSKAPKDPTITERSRRYLKKRKRAGYMQVRVVVHREDAPEIRTLARQLRERRVAEAP